MIMNGKRTKNQDIFVYPALQIIFNTYVHTTMKKNLKIDICCEAPIVLEKDGSNNNAKILMTERAK